MGGNRPVCPRIGFLVKVFHQCEFPLFIGGEMRLWGFAYDREVRLASCFPFVANRLVSLRTFDYDKQDHGNHRDKLERPAKSLRACLLKWS